MASLPPVGGGSCQDTFVPRRRGGGGGPRPGLQAPLQAGSPQERGDVSPSLIWVPCLVEDPPVSVHHRACRVEDEVCGVFCSL